MDLDLVWPFDTAVPILQVCHYINWLLFSVAWTCFFTHCHYCWCHKNSSHLFSVVIVTRRPLWLIMVLSLHLLLLPHSFSKDQYLIVKHQPTIQLPMAKLKGSTMFWEAAFKQQSNSHCLGQTLSWTGNKYIVLLLMQLPPPHELLYGRSVTGNY